MYNIYLDNLHVSENCEKVVDTSLPQRSCPQFGALPLKKLGQLDCLQDHYDDNSEEALRSLLSTEMDENSTPTSPITMTQDARIKRQLQKCSKCQKCKCLLHRLHLWSLCPSCSRYCGYHAPGTFSKDSPLLSFT